MSIISTKYLLQDAQANGYAVPAFNIHNAETIQAILEVCSEMRSPVILAGTPGTFKHIALEEIYALCNAYSTTYNMPLALHLDHHESLDDIRRKVHAGVRSAMIDGSSNHRCRTVSLIHGVAIEIRSSPPHIGAHAMRAQRTARSCSSPSVFMMSQVAPSNT